METLIDVGFVIVTIAFLVPAILVTWYSIKKCWTKRRILIVIVATFVTFLINPFIQVVILEPLDTKLNYKMFDRAVQFDIIGKTQEEIQSLFGEPHFQTAKTRQGHTYSTWEWKPLRAYWAGSKFQVFFSDGKVSGFEPNDD